MKLMYLHNYLFGYYVTTPQFTCARDDWVGDAQKDFPSPIQASPKRANAPQSRAQRVLGLRRVESGG